MTSSTVDVDAAKKQERTIWQPVCAPLEGEPTGTMRLKMLNKKEVTRQSLLSQGKTKPVARKQTTTPWLVWLMIESMILGSSELVARNFSNHKFDPSVVSTMIISSPENYNSLWPRNAVGP